MKKRKKQSTKAYEFDKRKVTVTEYGDDGKIVKRYKLIHGEEPCVKHPRYKGKSQPRAACRQCWTIFFAGEREYWNF